jgi:TPR repeat protein
VEIGNHRCMIVLAHLKLFDREINPSIVTIKESLEFLFKCHLNNYHDATVLIGIFFFNQNLQHHAYSWLSNISNIPDLSDINKVIRDEGLYKLAICYECGYGVKTDYDLAIKIFSKLPDDPKALYHIGFINEFLSIGFVTDKDYQNYGVLLNVPSNYLPFLPDIRSNAYEIAVKDRLSEKPAYASSKNAFDSYLKASKLGYEPAKQRLKHPIFINMFINKIDI